MLGVVPKAYSVCVMFCAIAGITYSSKSEEYYDQNPQTVWWLVTLTSALYSFKMLSQRNVRGEWKAFPIPNVVAFNVHECIKNVEMRGKLSKMFLRQKLDVCALSKTKLRWKGEVTFGEMVLGCLALGEVGQEKGWHCYWVGGCCNVYWNGRRCCPGLCWLKWI